MVHIAAYYLVKHGIRLNDGLYVILCFLDSQTSEKSILASFIRSFASDKRDWEYLDRDFCCCYSCDNRVSTGAANFEYS
jgi:hypothetical protein